MHLRYLGTESKDFGDGVSVSEGWEGHVRDDAFAVKLLRSGEFEVVETEGAVGETNGDAHDTNSAVGETKGPKRKTKEESHG